MNIYHMSIIPSDMVINVQLEILRKCLIFIIVLCRAKEDFTFSS